MAHVVGRDNGQGCQTDSKRGLRVQALWPRPLPLDHRAADSGRKAQIILFLHALKVQLDITAAVVQGICLARWC